jgi:hypothetical protein
MAPWLEGIDARMVAQAEAEVDPFPDHLLTGPDEAGGDPGDGALPVLREAPHVLDDIARSVEAALRRCGDVCDQLKSRHSVRWKDEGGVCPVAAAVPKLRLTDRQ